MMKKATHKRTRSLSPSGDDDGGNSASAEDNYDRLASPLLSLEHDDDIRAFLRTRVKEQENAVWTVTEKLMDMRETRRYVYDCPVNLLKLVFSGTSGCGKTEMVRWIKHLLGMDAGFEYERQYIEVVKERKDGCESITNHGHMIHPDADTLVDKLNDALKNYTSSGGGGGSGSSPKRKCTYPRFLLLVIDEVDTMENVFLGNITSLLHSGRCTKSSNNKKESFELPRETTLMIVFTCGYGKKGIGEMNNKSDQTATTHICTDMIQRGGMNEATIRRMGCIVPFYPLEIETLRMILMERLEQFIKESHICKQFGEITYHGDVKNLLIDKVINLTTEGRGVRQGLGKLLEKIGEFFEKALRELHKKKMVCETPKSNLVVMLREIDLKKFNAQIEKECQDFVNDIMRSILNDPRSVDTIAEYTARDEKLDTLSMYMEKDHVVSIDVGVDYAMRQNNLYNQCHGTSPMQVVLLKEKNQALEDTLDKVEMLVNKNTDGSSTFHRKIKAIVVKSKKTLSRYEEPTISPTQRSRLLLTNRVEEMAADESGESSPSATSSFEEEPRKPTVIERVLAKYADKKPEELDELTLSSEVDQDSEEDKRLERQRVIRNDACLKKKLLKRYTHTMIRCATCTLSKNAIAAFNPRLYKSRIGKPPSISFRTICNICRKK